MPARQPASAAAKKAAETLLAETLSAADPSIVRALKGVKDATKGDETATFLRTVTLKAGETMIEVALAGGKGEQLFEKLSSLLDAALGWKNASVTTISAAVTGLLKLLGELAGSLERASVKKMLVKAGSLFDNEDYDIRSAAVVATSTAIKAAIAAGSIKAAEEPTSLLTSSLETMAKAATPAEARTAACGVAAACGAIGEAALATHKVVDVLNETMDSKKKDAPSAREAAVLSVGLLTSSLGFKFEPYSIVMLPKLVKNITDKDKAVVDASCKACNVMMDNLSTSAVKSVIGALYEGMNVVGGGGRCRIECLGLVSLLAVRAPKTMGPCLHECIPIVMECLNDSNAKVQGAASTALPQLISCTENAEIATTLKAFIIEALQKPDTTFACIEEVLMTTFCNPMDGTALAFMMPLLIRGVKDANYALVKKATTCTSNLCALIKDASDVAPFIPQILPLLEKNLDHSSPEVRDATTNAKTKLLDGAGDMVDPNKRAKALAGVIAAGLKAMAPDVKEEVITYIGATGSAMLEEKLGGVVRVQLFKDAVPMLGDWIVTNLQGYIASLDMAEVAKIAGAAVSKFEEELSEAAKKILNESGDKDFAVDIQNIILAFAGRVLLRKADVRFERGHRYGLIGQNGTGKTTLLNRLAAKDIVGFPQNLKTWYIRHEVICDDGVDVRAFLTLHCPDEKKADVKNIVEGILDTVAYPEEMRSTFVNSLSGGWKMKLSVALSVLHEPELLLLDEPTNHLDPEAVQWLINHLLSLEGVTMAIVSHEYDFIDEVCTDVTHYDNGGVLGTPCKFEYYPMTFSQFQKLKPEVAAGLPRADGQPAFSDAGSQASSKAKSESVKSESSLSESMDKLSTADSEGSAMSTTLAKVDEMIAAGLIRPFLFPDPGKPDGIRTFRKPVMTLKDVSFKYPETDKYVVSKGSAVLTLGSRAVIVGGNGSGKSTVLKLLIGDLECEEGTGEQWRHHNLRQAYVAQQSLHHLEEYVQVTPIHYIQERFRQGLDMELSKLKTTLITEEDEESMKTAGAITEVVGRQQRGREMWYEVKKNGRMKDDTQFFPQAELEMGKGYVKKLIKNFDQKQQALDSGMAIRPITAAEILKHLEDFGIDSMLAHGKIRQMSGGQRQRLVICAAFWSKPHVIALDEPTNYLDNDSVAALTKALKDFKGAVVTVSENEAFTAEISNEKWVVDNGNITIVQLRDAKAR